MEPKRICIGAVRGAFGVRGEVRLASFAAEPAAIGDYGEVEDSSGERRFRIDSLRPVRGGFAARIAGIASREAAAALAGTQLFIDRARLPEPEADEFYCADLEGSEACSSGGARVGEVVRVHNFGAGDLLEIRFDADGAREFLPFTREDVLAVRPGRVVLAAASGPEAGGAPA